jgi:uncharacterized FlaG/YvyC family protein
VTLMLDPISGERSHPESSTVSETARPPHQEAAPKARHVDAALHGTGLPQAPVAGAAGARVTLSVDAQLRETIIKVVDPETGKVIRQIPAEERLRMQRAYEEEQHRQAAGQGGTGKGEIA